MPVNRVSHIPATLQTRIVVQPWMATALKVSLAVSAIALMIYLIYKRMHASTGTIHTVPFEHPSEEPPTNPEETPPSSQKPPELNKISTPLQTPSKTSNPDQPPTSIPSTPKTPLKKHLSQSPLRTTSVSKFGTPNTQQRSWMLQRLKDVTTNCPPIKEEPVTLADNCDLTESQLVELEKCFNQFDSKQFLLMSDDIKLRLSLFCELLEQRPQTYQYRALEDRQRIQTLLTNYREVQKTAATDPSLRPHFYAVHPVMFKQLDEINAFLKLIITSSAEPTWIEENYTPEEKIFEWCHYLEKTCSSLDEKKSILEEFFVNYNQVRQFSTKNKQLAAHIVIEPFHITVNKKGYTVKWAVLADISHFLTQFMPKKTIEGFPVQDYINICQVLWENPGAYQSRPQYLKDFIQSLNLSYHQNIRHLQEVLSANHKTS